jgi:hypothetical protein
MLFHLNYKFWWNIMLPSTTSNSNYKKHIRLYRWNSHHALMRCVPINTFKKECAMTLIPRLVLGFSPDTRRGEGKGYNWCPSWRKGGARGRHRVSVGKLTRLSPDYQIHAPPWPSKRDRWDREGPAGSKKRHGQLLLGCELPPPPLAVTNRTQQPEQTMPTWLDRARGLMKLPPPRCIKRATSPATPSLGRLSICPALLPYPFKEIEKRGGSVESHFGTRAPMLLAY